jgi:hypothetical protein
MCVYGEEKIYEEVLGGASLGSSRISEAKCLFCWHSL